MVAPLSSDVPAPETESLTVDQLAQRSGVSVRTIRFYAGRGLLPPPRLRGRTGLYGADHIARLELVGELSALGFTLSAIESHLERLPLSASAAELALKRALLTPWVPEQIEEIDRAELDRRAGRELSDDDIEVLVGLGVISRPDGDGVHLHGPGSLSRGLAVLDSGLPVGFWRDAHALIEKHTTALAEELMARFQEQVLQPYRDAGRPAEERSRLAEALAHLKPITVQGVVTAFGRAVNRSIRERIG